MSETPSAEKDARRRAVVAATDLGEAWVEFWDAIKALGVATLVPCRHCGKPPEVDGDHSCPCPYSDDNCPDHPPEGKPVPLWMARVTSPDKG